MAPLRWLAACILGLRFTLAQQELDQFEAQLHPCPAACTSSQWSQWTAYHSLDRLEACRQPMLLKVSTQNAFDDPSTANKIFACTQSDAAFANATTISPYGVLPVKARRRDASEYLTQGAGICNVANQPNAVWRQTTLSMQEGRSTGLGSRTIAQNTQNSIVVMLESYLQDSQHCNSAVILAYNLGMAAAVYTAPFVDRSSSINALRAVREHRLSQGTTNLLAQTCDSDRNSINRVGIALSHADDALVQVQAAVAALIKGECSTVLGQTNTEKVQIDILEIPIDAGGINGQTNLPSSGLSSPIASSSPVSTALQRRGRLDRHYTPIERRADCSTTTVQSGDGCYALAQRCGITQDQLQQYNTESNFCSGLQAGQKVCCSSGTLPSSGPPQNADGTCAVQLVESGDSCGTLATRCGITASNFMNYNPQPNLCSTLQVKQRVCCSTGSLPDIRPKQNSDGSCAVYTVQANDNCAAIAMSHGLQANDISTFNDKTTWGWNGCNDVQIGTKICLSTGVPPFPASINGAVCGPVVPGTTQPSGSTTAKDWTKLNPCPLNACCDVYGFCGTTPEFCTATSGPTDNPGTAPPGKPGCISNCGVDIVTSPQQASQISVGYYEAWNPDRNCLIWGINDIGTLRSYTHVHWAFATIDANNFDIVLNDSFNQWNSFQGSTSFKRILAFGGWGFSTEPSTYNVLRAAMEPANVDRFVGNIVKFLQSSNIDGVDFDWEYPGAPDIPGIPAGLASDGPNYLNMLRKLRFAVGNAYSISIAAPASYWYLRSFPLVEMHPLLDYMVYMTYDLHGQWDYGNKWSQENCGNGNCLRSHVNATETKYALAMITKAGVPANKIAVGVASYGRSFKMTDPNCTGPQCTYTGPQSGAQPGVCTNVAGYISNAELETVIDANGLTPRYDPDSDSIILVYDSNTWVSYMDNNTIISRINYYKGLGFAGSAEWAIDLSTWTPNDGDVSTVDGIKVPGGTKKPSTGIPFGYRDQRQVCTPMQDQSYRNEFNRVYQDCYNADIAGFQPRASGSTACLTESFHDDNLCKGGCTGYQIVMKDTELDTTHCSYYRKRFEKYLDGFVLGGPCDLYWKCEQHGDKHAGTLLQMALLTPQADHLNSMLNDMFTTVQRSQCK